MRDLNDIGLEHYEKKIYDQKQLLDISKALNSTLDYRYLIDAILNICLAQLQTIQAAIFLEPDIDAGFFKLEPSYKGFDFDSAVTSKQIEMDTPIIHFFEEKTKAMAMKTLRSVDMVRMSKEFQFFESLGAEIIVPLNAKGKINGLLVLGEKMTQVEFSESEKEFITILSNLAGIAVDNARLYELATVDMMTGLKIHHYFQTKLREEMDRCRKKGAKLAILFTDVDKFKVFNDTYGHQAGDVVLIEVAKQLINLAGKNHLAARYGGEEFCIVMPNSSLEQGFEMGEKVRNAVQAMTVINPADGKELKVTISIGVSEFWPSDKSNKDIIERADKALYQAKHSGRNRTICFNPDGM